eukprot:TRINITY_DN4109_c0_g1_i1.p2 TRINITY_DN4109_c0_g1~~TRINITY_DN4109_c0_g1_i1.p2  ORF type:complete len:74 (+),score=2.74 TRINITY_DN4109_c0_g1_i1:103-324(+)
MSARLESEECKSSELGCTWQKTCFSSDPRKCFPERSQAEQDAVCAGIVNDRKMPGLGVRAEDEFGQQQNQRVP